MNERKGKKMMRLWVTKEEQEELIESLNQVDFLNIANIMLEVNQRGDLE